MLRRRALQVSLQRQAHHRLDLGADEVRRDADDAVAAHRHHRVGLVIVAGPDEEAGPRIADDVRRLAQVTAGLLDAHDVGDLAQADDGVGRHVDGGAAGHVVEDDRKVGALPRRP